MPEGYFRPRVRPCGTYSRSVSIHFRPYHNSCLTFLPGLMHAFDNSLTSSQKGKSSDPSRQVWRNNVSEVSEPSRARRHSSIAVMFSVAIDALSRTSSKHSSTQTTHLTPNRSPPTVTHNQAHNQAHKSTTSTPNSHKRIIHEIHVSHIARTESKVRIKVEKSQGKGKREGLKILCPSLRMSFSFGCSFRARKEKRKKNNREKGSERSYIIHEYETHLRRKESKMKIAP